MGARGLVPVPGAPAIRRRLLDSFNEERMRTFGHYGGSTADVPLRWLKSPAAELIRDEAILAPGSHAPR